MPFALPFLSCLLVAGGGVEGADISTDGSTCFMSTFRFFLGGDCDCDFVKPGVSGSWAGVLSKVAFAFLVFAFSLASSRRAFRRA